METQQSIESGERRAKVAMIFICLSTLFSISTTILEIAVGDWVDGELYEDEYSWTTNHMMLIMLAASYWGLFLASIVSIITFIMWFWRGYDNLAKLGSKGMDSKVMTAVCWFIPLGNLYMPYMYMRDMFRNANELLSNSERIIARSLSIGLVVVWWILFLYQYVFSYGVSYCFGQLFALRLLKDQKVQMIVGSAYSIFSLVATILFLIFTVWMISSYAKAEKKLFEQSDILSNQSFNN